MSPYRNKTWEFFMTPILSLIAGLVIFVGWVLPTGYIVEFQVRALSEEEFEMWDEEDDDF